MRYRKILMLLSGLTLFMVMACKDKETQAASATGLERLSITTPEGRRDFSVELAVTPAQMQKGLMNRDSMSADAGMLFYFGNEDERGFYMKNTLIPLDMIFIRKNGIIHSIHENAKPLDETTIFSKGPVAAVLELNGGMADKLGIKPGQQVHHTFFGNAVK